MKAILHWGKATVRPQQIYPSLLESRRLMNQFDDDMDSTHPYADEVYNWTLTTKMLKAVPPPERFKIALVEDPDTLMDAARQIAKEGEISVSIKSTDDSFLGMICLLLVGTPSTVYIIDAIKLHAVVGRVLQKVFKNPFIVKLFFLGKDVPLLQRDFAIFPVGIVLAQEVYSYLYPEQSDVSKHELFSTLCNYQLDPLMDYADYCHRPIHSDLMNLVTEEAWHLLRSWIGLKGELKDILPMAELERSKCANLVMYTGQQQTDHRESFDISLQHLPVMMRSTFDTPKQFGMFARVMEWRERQCQISDSNMDHFLPLRCVGQIVRALPIKIDSIHTLYSPSKRWNDVAISSLLEIFTNQRDSPGQEQSSETFENCSQHDHSASGSGNPGSSRSHINVNKPPERRVQDFRRIDGNRGIHRRKNRGRKEKQRSAARALMHRIYKEGL
jgi:ribonuclease D